MAKNHLVDMNTKLVVIIGISDWEKYDVSTLSMFNDIYEGTTTDLSAPSKAYDPSIEQSRMVGDLVALDNSFKGLWIKTHRGKVVAEQGDVMELLGTIQSTG